MENGRTKQVLSAVDEKAFKDLLRIILNDQMQNHTINMVETQNNLTLCMSKLMVELTAKVAEDIRQCKNMDEVLALAERMKKNVFKADATKECMD